MSLQRSAYIVWSSLVLAALSLSSWEIRHIRFNIALAFLQNCTKGDHLINEQQKNVVYFDDNLNRREIVYSVAFKNGQLNFSLPPTLSNLTDLRGVKLIIDENDKFIGALIRTKDFQIYKNRQMVNLQNNLESRSWPSYYTSYGGYLYYTLVNSMDNQICY